MEIKSHISQELLDVISEDPEIKEILRTYEDANEILNETLEILGYSSNRKFEGGSSSDISLSFDSISTSIET